MSDLVARLQNLTPLQRAAYALRETQNRLAKLQQRDSEPIAIIGMSCRFPGSSNDPIAFWNLIRDGRDAITVVPKDRWDADAYYDPNPMTPGKMVTKWGAFIDAPGNFDHRFFGMTEQESLYTDPQQRMLLELTWEAFEDAGLLPSVLRGSNTGVFYGVGMNEYLSRVLHAAARGSAYASIGNSAAASANRVSYAFDLRGPSVAIDTACSSALVAIHQACHSLRSREVDTALAGATNLQVNPLTTMNLTKAGVCSPDGKLRAFDAKANGFVRGDGLAVLVLKRLSDAEAAGDRIYATILGSAVNHNGGGNGLSAPRRETQEQVIKSACKSAGVSPDDVSYVEAHGTGTPIGDALEIAAMQSVYGSTRDASSPLLIGAIKTNFGHTETASGIAGLMKVVLSLQHEYLPPTLNFEAPHPDSRLQDFPIQVVRKGQPWPDSERPRIAGVSSFGFGGANAHVLLKSYQKPSPTSEPSSITDDKFLPLVLTARSAESLDKYAKRLLGYLANTNDSWFDICWTSTIKRDLLDHRVAIIATDKQSAIQALEAYLNQQPHDSVFTSKLGSKSSTTISLETLKSHTELLQLMQQWMAGKQVSFASVFRQTGKLASLPHYAWNHQCFWIDPEHPDQSQGSTDVQVATNQPVSKGKRPRPNLANSYEEAANATEAWLAELWCNALDLESVGVLDNFFHLGGHSLLAAQIVSRVEEQRGISLPLRELFEKATIRELAEFLDNHQNANKVDALPALLKRSAGDESPLSLSQEALWFLDRLNPNSGAYVTYPMIRIIGSLDLEILHQSLLYVVQRHEVLRTTFPETNGRPVQMIAPKADAKLEVHDFSTFDVPYQQQQQIEDWVAKFTSQAIDLQQGPVVRLQVAKLNAEEHIIAIAWHHIIHDGWSLGVLARDLMTAYRCLRDNVSIDLPELAVQYSDWAIWQRRLLEGDYATKLRTYWKTKLADVPALDLVTDFPRPSVRTTQGDFLEFKLDPDLSSKIDKLAQQHSVTPFMVLLTAYHLTLARFSGQTDFAIGSPVANRRKRETEQLIGYFINMVVLRPTLSNNATFAEALQSVKQTVLEAFEHQDYTLDQVVHAVNPPREPSRHPLFQAMFVLQTNAPLPTDGLNLKFEPFGGPADRTSYFELNLALSYNDGVYSGPLLYNRDLFSQSTVQRIMSAMQLLLEAMTSNPADLWQKIDIVDSSQAEQLKRFSRPSEIPIAVSDCSCRLEQMIERQAQLSPDNVALIDNHRSWTYSELNAVSERFAKRLKEQGVAPGDIVAHLVPRSADAIVAIVGILKTGAAYMPLDEKSPTSRNEASLADSRAQYIVCEQDNSSFSASNLVRISCHGIADVDESHDTYTVSDCECRSLSSAAPAYVIYTSGSTGKPKGVVISHSAAVAYVEAARREYGITANDRVLQFASLSFDAHVEEVFITLAVGGTLVLRSEEMMNSIEDFLRGCEAMQISVLSLATGFWHEIAHETVTNDVSLPTTLRTIVFGGEAMSSERAEAWLRKHGTSVRLINSYGPTETTVVATTKDIANDVQCRSSSIGRPLANTRAYVLDQFQRPVPIGVRGDLWLGGLSVANGYLYRDELTAQRFVLDRFDDGCFGFRDIPQMYKTGDIVAWTSEGELTFFGRSDHQIKIRGFRVEIGEIESAIRLHPLINDVVVIATGYSSQQQLVAYIVTEGPDVINTLTLRQFLLQSLPDYMIPQQVVVLDSIPLTTSGKVDRKRLPNPDLTASTSVAFEEPQGDIEKSVAQVFAEILQIPRVSRHDDFFAIGGNSLLALRLVSRIKSETKSDLPIVQVFKNSTVQSLALYIEDHNEHRDDEAVEEQVFSLASYHTSDLPTSANVNRDNPNLIELRPGTRPEALFLIHGLGGHVVNFVPLARALQTDRSIYALQGCGIDGQGVADTRIETMAERYLEQILAHQPTGTIQLIGWSMGGLIAMEIVRRMLQANIAVEPLILLDTHLSLSDPSLQEITEESILKLIAPKVGIALKDIKHLPIDRQWDNVLQASQELLGVDPEDTGVEEIRALAKMCKAHLIAIGNYVPQSVDIEAIMLKASKPWRVSDPRWRTLTKDFRSITVHGTHYSMLAQPDVAEVARKIETLLASRVVHFQAER